MASELNWLDSDNDRSNRLMGLAGNDWHRDDFIDCLLAVIDSAQQVTDLVFLWNCVERELRFFLRPEFSHILCIQRFDHGAVAIEKTVKDGGKIGCHWFVGALAFPVHHIAQLVFGVWIQKIEGVILQRGVDARLFGERAATCRERCTMHFLDVVQRGHLALKFVLQLLLRACRQLPLRQVNSRDCDARDYEHHDGKQLDAKAEKTGFRRCGLQAQGKFTRRVDPLVNSTGRSSVVLLLNHALSV